MANILRSPSGAVYEERGGVVYDFPNGGVLGGRLNALGLAFDNVVSDVSADVISQYAYGGAWNFNAAEGPPAGVTGGGGSTATAGGMPPRPSGAKWASAAWVSTGPDTGYWDLGDEEAGPPGWPLVQNPDIDNGVGWRRPAGAASSAPAAGGPALVGGASLPGGSVQVAGFRVPTVALVAAAGFAAWKLM